MKSTRRPRLSTISTDRNLLPGLALALFGSVAFGGKAIIVKLAYRHGVDAVTLLMLRMFFALPIFLLMAWWSSRGKPPLSRRDWLGVVGLRFTGYYLSSFLDFAGLRYITASLERLILYLNPTLVLLLGWLLYRKTARPAQLAGMAISYCGVVLVFGHEVQQGSQAALGALLVFGSAVAYATYLVSSGELVQRLGSLRLVGWATSVACLCCLLQFAILRPIGSAFEVAPQVIWLSVLNATVCTAAPVLMVMMAIERIGPALSAQMGMLGPMSTILMGVLILGEPFTAWIAAGTVLVLAGIFVFSRSVR
ncbi:MAG: DMT family transporter [Ramlibacter sp.]|nr:DMT family transporter [Ramlibacter sp.]